MSEPGRMVLVTGANGFLGRALCGHLSSAGYRVRALVRDPGHQEELKDIASAGVYQFQLPGIIQEEALEGEIAAVVHCARAEVSDFQPTQPSINVEGTQALLNAVRKVEAGQFVFISSLAAHEQAESSYGRDKLAIEGILDTKQDLIIRPGLILGRGGLFGRMLESLKRFPLVPLFYGGHQQLQYIAIEDVCHAIEQAIARGLKGNYRVAHPEAVDIRRFYSSVAEHVGKPCRFVRLPGKPTLFLLKWLERNTEIRLPISSENLLGLKKMRVFDTLESLSELGIEPMNLNACLESLGTTERSH